MQAVQIILSPGTPLQSTPAAITNEDMQESSDPSDLSGANSLCPF
jgi:hypothetical protein